MFAASRTARFSLLALGLTALLVPAVVACKKEKKVSAADCNAALSSAGAAVERAENAVNTSTRCNADADCVEANTARCLVGCGGHAVPKVASSSFSAAVLAVDNDQCKRWADGNCDALVPRSVPSCPSYTSRCRDHACKMIDGRNLSAVECEELYGRAQKATRAAMESADRTCMKTTDCTQSAIGPSCFSFCGGAPVSIKGAPALDAALKQIDDDTCAGWVSGMCRETTPKPIPSCAPYVATCAKGHCENTLVLPK